MKKITAVMLTVMALGATLAWAVSEKVDSDGSAYPRYFKSGLYIGPATVRNPTTNTANKVTGSYGASSTIDFASATLTPVDSSAITVKGVQAGDTCMVGVPTAAGALKAQFTCYVSAADAVKVKFMPLDTIAGTITLSTGTGTAAVTAGSLCTCTDGTANASVKCAVVTTTLTATGTGSDVIAYHCAAPVDPASGTFYIRVSSSQ